MNKRDADPKLDERLLDAAKENAEKISGSAIFLTLFSENMAKDVIPVLQMGIAMYLDKPIYLLVPEGVEIPGNLLRVAQGIEYFKRDPNDMTSIQRATDRLLAAWKERES